MDTKRYTIAKSSVQQAPPNRITGLYTEMTIDNMAPYDVVSVDRAGKVTIIPPCVAYVRSVGDVIISVRSTAGETVDSRVYRRPDDKLSTTQYIVSENELNTAPVYVEELDIVVCRREHLAIANHPFSMDAFSEAYDRTAAALKDEDITPTLRLTANDPLGRIDKLFVNVFNRTILMKVTNVPSHDLTFRILMTCGDQNTSFVFGHDISSLINGETVYGDPKLGIIIGTSREAVDKFRSEHPMYYEYKEEFINHIKAEAIYNHKIESEKKQEELSATIAKLLTEVASLKNDVGQGKLELYKTSRLATEMTTQRDEYKAMYDANYSIVEREAALVRSRHLTDISQSKVEQAKISQSTEKIKYGEVIVKVIGGIAIAVITALVTSYLKDRRK